MASGPVKVVSTSGGNLLVSERNLYNNTFSEFTAIPQEGLSSEQLLSWYDELSPGMKNYVVIGNQGNQTADVDVKISGTVVGHYSIPAGGRVTPVFPGQMNGPLQVVSTEGNPELVVSQRTAYYNSFDELPGTHIT